jgi:hypothetical protein
MAPSKMPCVGSIFAAYRTLEIAAALNLEPCFTPVEIPESNGMAESFVKTFSDCAWHVTSIRPGLISPPLIFSPPCEAHAKSTASRKPTIAQAKDHWTIATGPNFGLLS